MRLKVFYDKGREYYMLFFGFISILTLIGVWLPKLVEITQKSGLNLSEGAITLILMGFIFIGINTALLVIGWFSYSRNITQQELLWRDIQHPSTVLNYISVARLYKQLDKLSEGISNSLSDSEAKEFLTEWNEIKNQYPLKLKIGGREILDFENLTLTDLEDLLEKAKSIKK